MGKLVDITGQQFHEWTALSYNTEARKWLCRCSCGIEKLVSKGDLKNGMTKSCGHARLEDLTGQKFNFWTVIRRDDSVLKPVRWICLCVCGTEKSIAKTDLKRGSVKSCGCQTKALIAESRKGKATRFTDYTGKQIGEYKVLRRAPNKGNRTYWTCQCSCGVVKDVWAATLASATDRTNCGHDRSDKVTETWAKKREEYIGMRFGFLTVTKIYPRWSEKSQQNFTIADCDCACGNKCSPHLGSLLGGEVLSCGCYSAMNTSVYSKARMAKHDIVRNELGQIVNLIPKDSHGTST